MFDTTIKQAYPYAKTVTINENKAPTDESVKLLRELEQVARNNIFSVLKVTSTQFEAVGITERDIINNGFNWRIKYKLNGKEFIIDGFEDTFTHDMRKIGQSLRDKLAHHLALNILDGCGVHFQRRMEENAKTL